MKTNNIAQDVHTGPEPLLAIKDLEAIFRVSTRTVYRLVERRQLPPPIRIGRSLRWRAGDLREFLAER